MQSDAVLKKVNGNYKDWKSWWFLLVLLVAMVGREMIRARPVKSSNVLLFRPPNCVFPPPIYLALYLPLVRKQIHRAPSFIELQQSSACGIACLACTPCRPVCTSALVTRAPTQECVSTSTWHGLCGL